MQISQIMPPAPDRSQSQSRIQQVAHEFESIFTSMMLRAMRKTVGNNPLLPQSFGEKVYTDLLDDKYASMISNHASLGLSDLIVKELEQNSSLSNPDAANDILNKDYLASNWMIDNRFIRNSSDDSFKNNFENSEPLMKRVRKWDNYIEKAANIFGVDKNLVSAVIAAESGGNPYAVSHAGAKGLMQLIDSTAMDMGVSQVFSPWSNIKGGTRYLRMMLDRQNGNEELALASYNAGPSAVDKYKGVPPYTETQNYVKTVLRLKDLFARGE